MSKFLIYVQNPERPDEFHQTLADLGAKKHSGVSWIIESDLRLETLLVKIGQWVQKEGFIFIADLTDPHDEMYWPAAARQHLPKARTVLKAVRAQCLTPPRLNKITVPRRSPCDLAYSAPPHQRFARHRPGVSPVTAAYPLEKNRRACRRPCTRAKDHSPLESAPSFTGSLLATA